MTAQSEANKRERSLGENVMVVMLVALLMSVFLYYFFQQEKNISQAGFNIAATNFSSKVTAIRAQWFMEHQPAILTIKEQDGGQLKVVLNNKGWIDFGDVADNCRKIWQVLISQELKFINQTVAVIDVVNTENPLFDACRYRLPSGEYFDYFSNTGRVVSATNR
ncbi:hypothetical protein tinsulaeT_12070 [Thalassotalea insulae]|uniref:Uncharacterized protein n=1 Tax=Thalassotalea insulae TaxID=2056778 RepID=A0ABQ6GT79_9GAMM|nr:hypothetical protein [Thalassotalea insulae]GLX77867.1 hypothetical protein tinsulaeT_12070 [Thalassotalea insulae]